MSNTYTQIYLQIIFSTRGHKKIIPIRSNSRIQKYITGLIQQRHHKLLAINNTLDHIHIFIGLNPQQSISDLVRDIKLNSTKFINAENLTLGHFAWQEGFGAFSYSRSQIDSVVKYISDQAEHHRFKTFQEEYLAFLKAFDVEYDHRYVFG